ncbi:MAG: DUF503 domain-containing protein [Chloroflexi bacterium]|nr:DUF503 domain-containing protein [Chloroflexota bacterium]
MHIGVCTIQLRMPENGSLKDKRQVIRSVTDRVRGRFNVSIAEVADNDVWGLTTLGFACVSNDARHAEEMLSNVVSYIEGLRLDAEVLDIQTEVISGV